MLRPTRISDVLTWRRQRAWLWWHIERRIGEGRCLSLAARASEACSAGSTWPPKRGGIRDRDVRILELLTPHLVQLYRQAAVRRRRPR